MAWTLKFESFSDRKTKAPHLRICVGKWKAYRQRWTAGPIGVRCEFADVAVSGVISHNRHLKSNPVMT